MVVYRRERFQLAEAVLLVLEGEVPDSIASVFDQPHNKCRLSGSDVCMDLAVESLNTVSTWGVLQIVFTENLVIVLFETFPDDEGEILAIIMD
jgi:hypothetical protein